MTRVDVQIPDEFVEGFGGEEAARDHLHQLSVIEAVRRHFITRSHGAQLLGISRWDFEDLLAEHNVPTLELTDEELAEQSQPFA